jgi:hypothetical protein
MLSLSEKIQTARRKFTKKRARFVTAAGLINELVEAQQHNLLSRALQRWARYDLIVWDLY